MTTKALEDYTFAELKVMYPNFITKTKKELISIVQANLEEIDAKIKADNLLAEQLEYAKTLEVDLSQDVLEEDDENENLTWYTIVDYIKSEAKGYKKILITCPSAMEADLLMTRFNSDLFPQLNEEGISVMSSSTRRDMHLNGTCYIRLVCIANSAHIARLMRYTEFKNLV
jgi:hypothetical protein